MKKAMKKMYMSILMITMSLLAAVATTFAWVGIASNSTFDEFTLNLNTDNDTGEYGIQLSLDGKNFYESIEPAQLKKVILDNMGYNSSQYGTSDSSVNNFFRKISLTQSTVSVNKDNSAYMGGFYDMNGNLALNNGRLTFDIYVTIFKISFEDNTSSTSDDDSDISIYLKDQVFYSEDSGMQVINKVVYPNSNPEGQKILGATSEKALTNALDFGEIVDGYITLNAASSCRLSIQKTSAVVSGNPNSVGIYTGATIYQSGGQYPSTDGNGKYDFGGVLPKEYNFAYQHYTSLNSGTFDRLETMVAFEDVVNRGDVTFKDDGNINKILSKSIDGIDTNKMVKLTFNFWFEGWDSDCTNAIQKTPINIDLNFSTVN